MTTRDDLAQIIKVRIEHPGFNLYDLADAILAAGFDRFIASVRAEAEAKGRAEVIDLFAHMSNEEFEWDGGLESLQERGWLPNEPEDTNGK